MDNLDELRSAMQAARAASSTQVIVIDTTHTRTTEDGGTWWEVAVPEVSPLPAVQSAHADYLQGKQAQRL